MAEAFLRRYAADKYEAYSAGLEPKEINPYTIRVMEEVGISLDDHTSKSIKQYMGKEHFAYFFTVCDQAEKACPDTFVMSVGRHTHWSFEDPAAFEGTEEEKLAKFREIRDRIDQKLKGWLGERGIAVP
jgi:arsenate reductase